MSDNVIYIDEDDDKTIFQTEEDLKKVEKEIAGLTDEDTTEVEITHQMNAPKRPYWQQAFG